MKLWMYLRALPMAYNGTMSGMRSGTTWLLSLALLCTSPTLATTVYRTVNENGSVTFSDVPPASGSVDIIEIDPPPQQPDDKQQQRLEDMRATTDRMAQARRAREKHRAELRELRAESRTQYVPRYPLPDTYTGVYPRRRGHGLLHRPGHHAGVHPPLRPHKPQLRRRTGFNDYPASLIRRKYSPAVREAFR